MKLEKNQRKKIFLRIVCLCLLNFFGVAESHAASSARFKVSGLSDVDEIRREVQSTPTTTENFLSRRAALTRWWRLLWHQGFDMSECSAAADSLYAYDADSKTGQRQVDQAYAILERIQEKQKKIPEVKGRPSAMSSKTDWPMYLSTDGSQSGFSPDTGPTLGERVWRFPKHRSWTAKPVISDGKVYVSSPGPDVVGFCMDEQTGKIEWRARQYGVALYEIRGSQWDPVVSTENALFRIGGLGYSELIIDKKTGQRVEYEKGDAKESNQLMVSTTSNGRLIVNDAKTGHSLWRFEMEGPAAGDPVLLGGRIIYAATKAGSVYCIDTREKSTIWKRELAHEFIGEMSIANGRACIGTKDGQIVTLDAKTGKTLWTWKCDAYDPKAIQFFSTPREGNGSLYVGAANGKVYSLNPTTGQLNWQFSTESWVRSRPIVIGDTIYVATLDSELFALKDLGTEAVNKGSIVLGAHGFTADLVANRNRILLAGRDLILYSVSPKTGKLQWKSGIIDGAWIKDEFHIAGWTSGFQSSPAVVEDTVYIGGPDGFVNAIDVATGKEKWRFEVGGVLSGVPVVAEGMVFIGEISKPGRYCALDKDTGKLIWETEKFGTVWVAPAYNDGMLFFGNKAGDVYGVNAKDGSIVWTYYVATDTPLRDVPRTSRPYHGFPPGVYSNPAIDDTTLYLGSWVGCYFAFDQKTGAVKWRTFTKAKNGGLPDSAAPMLHKNYLYVQKAGSAVAAINKETGEIEWEWEVPPGYLQNGTVVAHGDKIFASMGRDITKIPYHATIVAFNDVENGSKKLWEYDGGGGLTAPALTKGKIIFGSSADVFLTCLNTDDGSVIWRHYTGGEMLENVPAIYGNMVFVQTKNGWLNAVR